MENKGIINIHGKMYMTVARRLELANEEKNLLSVNTEVLQFAPVVVIKATITTKTGTYTGISSANPLKTIEKSNPFEVAETSAVGRALGFAGYGLIESVASADEMTKALNEESQQADEPFTREPVSEKTKECLVHEVEMIEAISTKTGNPYWSHKDENGKRCFGKGFM